MADPTTVKLALTALSVGGQLASGENAESVARYEARQMERNAGERFARGTREAEELRRQGDVTISDARAEMAASGGVTTDPQATFQLAELAELRDYNALSAMYEAETEAAAMEAAAEATRVTGKAKKRMAQIGALTTALTGGLDIYEGFKKDKLQPIDISKLPKKLPTNY